MLNKKLDANLEVITKKLVLFDSYKKSLVEFELDNEVKIYSCGPTVYQYQHIGNLRAVWLPDTLCKALKLAGIKTHWVLNITDVGHLVGDGDGQNVSNSEDKMEKASRLSGKSVKEIVNFYTQDFIEQCQVLELEIPTNLDNPKASDYILEQMLIALELVKAGRAYFLTDGIYFDAEANKDLEVPFRMVEGDTNFTGREIKNTIKSGADFALWKFVEPNSLQKWRFADFEPAKKLMDEIGAGWGTDGWLESLEKGQNGDYCLGNLDIEQVLDLAIKNPVAFRWGSPGWHSECVAMISARFGGVDKLPIDIHFGGEDHIHIHHKNEIWQSEALGFHLSRFWVHNKFVLVDGKKMSKSLGNVFLVKGEKKETGFDSLVELGFDPLAYRLMMFEHHYSEQLNFTFDKLQASQKRLYNLRKEVAKIRAFAKLKGIEEADVESKSLQIYIDVLLHNLDTPKFLEKYQNLIDDVSTNIQNKGELNPKNLALIVKLDQEMAKLELVVKVPLEIEQTAEQRLQAKVNKDYKQADEIRKQVLEMGWQIDDHNFGGVVSFGVWKLGK